MFHSRYISRHVRTLSYILPRRTFLQKSLTAAYSVQQKSNRNLLNNVYPYQSNYVFYSAKSNAWEDKDFKDIVDNNKIVVFMKGTPDAPQCGFSRYVIQILFMHGCEGYKTFNVLEDDTLRNRIKEFSEWPTVPQVYINGEFVGGFDILLQMHQSGDLIEKLMEVGHRSVLLDADKTEK